MEQDHSFAVQMTLLTSGLTLLGVIVGAILTPIATYFIEKTKTKLSLRPRLLKSIYIFFNYRKVTIELANQNALKSQASKFMWDDLRKQDLEDTEREEIKREFDVYMEAIHNNNSNLDSYFQLLIETESDIHSLLSMVQVHYGQDKYIKLSNFINPFINRSNSNQYFDDYKKLTFPEFKKAQAGIQEKLLAKFSELNSDCNRVINLVNFTL